MRRWRCAASSSSSGLNVAALPPADLEAPASGLLAVRTRCGRLPSVISHCDPSGRVSNFGMRSRYCGSIPFSRRPDHVSVGGEHNLFGEPGRAEPAQPASPGVSRRQRLCGVRAGSSLRACSVSLIVVTPHRMARRPVHPSGRGGRRENGCTHSASGQRPRPDTGTLGAGSGTIGRRDGGLAVKVGVLQFFGWADRKIPLESIYQRAIERFEIMDRTGYDAVAGRAPLQLQRLPVAGDGDNGGGGGPAPAHRHRGVTRLFYHPLRLAEEVALLDVLSGGRTGR